jgi:MarR family transcriptional regulator for hemolysin
MVSSASPLGRSIGRTNKAVHTWGDHALAEVDSSVTEWAVLFNIDRAAPPGASQAEIARYSNMGSPALVRHIDRLEADGLVLRTRDAADRRVTRLNLTSAGRKHLEVLRAVVARGDKQLRSLLTKAEAEAMQRALDKIFAFCVGELYGEEAASNLAPTASPRHDASRTPTRRTR